MSKKEHFVKVLMAEDDADDRLLIGTAFKESKVGYELCFVNDGKELMDYLYNQGKYDNPDNFPRPDLILLDLNMPRKDGREALGEIKSDKELKSIPVVILTTSQAEEDISGCYAKGANSYITKPMKYEILIRMVKELDKYWFDTVELPGRNM